MRYFGGGRLRRQTRSAADGFCTRTPLASKVGCPRLSMPLRRLVRPFKGYFGAPSSHTEPAGQVQNQESRVSEAAPMAMLAPEYEGPISDPCTSAQQTVKSGVVLQDCIATTGSQASVGASIGDTVPSEAGAAPDMAHADNLDTTSTDNPTVAQAPCHHSLASMDDGQGQSTHQAVTDCQQQPVQEAPATTVNPPVAAAANDASCNAVADSPQPSASQEESFNTACSCVSAGDACDSSHVVHTAMVASLLSSEVQHAAVDQVLDELLAEVSAALPNQVADDLLAEAAAPFQAVQSSIPADIGGMVSPMVSPRVSPRVSLPANPSAGPMENFHTGCSESAEDAADTISDDHMAMVDVLMTSEVQHAAVDQVLGDLLAEVSAPPQAVQSSMPADTSGRVSRVGSPSQAKCSSAELTLVVPSSSSSGKENIPVVEARHVSMSRGLNQDRAVGRGRMCCLDRSTFQEVAQALPPERRAQLGHQITVCWIKEKIADLGGGPAHLTILTSLPPPSSALPIVLRMSTGTEDWESSECSSLAKAAMLMHRCAHPNVVPITLLGLQAPVSPLTPLDPCQVAYFGMPMADLSLQKRMGQQAWGKSSCAASAYQGPSLATLVQHGKAILKPLAHIHRHRVLHRGLTPDHVLLFSKVKLAGFGSAARLTGQGCAIQPSPYRCEEGYVPPEAHQGSPLSTAADVYQFGGLCYFMAMGTHPPAGLHQASLPDCVAEEWRQLVSLCRAGNPVERPTVAQLQLYLHSICHQPVKQAPKAIRSPGKASPAVPAQRYSSGHRQGLPFPAMSHRGVQALEVATSHSAAALPHMASNCLFTPSSTPAEVSPADRKVAFAAPSQCAPLTGAATPSRPVARAQRASATAAQALSAFIAVPQLTLGVDQWLPEESISCVEHRPGGSLSSHHAAAGSQQSSGRVDGDTAAAGRGGAAMHLLTTAGGDSGAAHSIGSSQAAAGPLDNGSTGCGEQASEASMILRAVVPSHQPPACPKKSLSELAGFGDTADGTAAAGMLIPGTTGSKLRGVLGYAKTAVPVSGSYATIPLLMCTDNSEQEGRQWEAGQLVSPSRFHASSGLIHSPVARTPPRRDDTALEKGGVTRWIAQAQGQAAHLAAVVNERAAGTSSLLQQWSETQLSTKPVAVSHTAPVIKRELLWAVSGRKSSAGPGSIVAHTLGVNDA
ncbi:hypothetical protein WJX77_003621 [Trebouxia sp. C0004]